VRVALVQPWVVVPTKTRWRLGAGFHAVFEAFELSIQLLSTANEEPFIDAYDFHLKRYHEPVYIF